MDPSERWTVLYLEGVLADPDGNTDEARAKALEDLAWWASLQYEGKLTLRPEGDLRGHLKVAHEHLSAAQPQCVIVASRHQLQAALDRISYVAAREGIEPGDTFTPLADLRPDVLATTPSAGPYHVATVTIEADGSVHGYANADASMPTITIEPGTAPGLYHVMSDGTWVAQPGFGNSGRCSRACTEGHTYTAPCELARDLVDPEPLWTLGRIREVLDDPFCPEHERAKALRMLRVHEELDSCEAVACEPVRDLPALAEEATPVRGVPFLLEQLAAMSQESVYLWHTPTRSQPWFVWTGAPAGTGGGEWGAGPTAQAALADAFQRITSAIFDGRVVR